jgi:apolipoprotein N-acyltransferase
MNDNQNTKIGTLICFESVFPDLVAEMTANGAEFLIIITNDDWWRDTAGHRQHFAFARLHAIENRRPIARAANTGISGFIDAWGRVSHQTEYKEKTVITASLISPKYTTFFSLYEKWIRIIILIIAGIVSIKSRTKSTKSC